jgi:hypothetical protein
MPDRTLGESRQKNRGNAGKGRKKGIPNKLTKTVREMVLNALDELGGEAFLVSQGRENPTAFMTLLGRLVPTQLSADIEVNGQVSFEEIMGKAVVITGGLPGWEERNARQIGEIFEKYRRGEPLPDPLVIGGIFGRMRKEPEPEALPS